MAATHLHATREDMRVAYLAALAIVIHVVEAGLPSPLPGIKPGLANIVTVLVLMCFGLRTAAWVTLLRVVAGSLVVGSFLSPTFLMSFSGAVAALLALAAGGLVPGMGAVGYSVLAGMAHMATQFSVAYLLFVPHPALWAMFPVFMTASVGFGVINGIIAAAILGRINTRTVQRPQQTMPLSQHGQ
ncbi:Gx transporter family protein [Ectothiorhodospiraceae bacterium WFHF3C12]|nr:Gx transporter family protein [Ectothiorhodospiraceae bacterium WFHF3C12]